MTLTAPRGRRATGDERGRFRHPPRAAAATAGTAHVQGPPDSTTTARSCAGSARPARVSRAAAGSLAAREAGQPPAEPEQPPAATQATAPSQPAKDSGDDGGGVPIWAGIGLILLAAVAGSARRPRAQPPPHAGLHEPTSRQPRAAKVPRSRNAPSCRNADSCSRWERGNRQGPSRSPTSTCVPQMVKAGVWLTYRAMRSRGAVRPGDLGRSNRGLLLALFGVGIATALAIHLCRPERLLRSRYADAFFVTWSLSVIAADRDRRGGRRRRPQPADVRVLPPDGVRGGLLSPAPVRAGRRGRHGRLRGGRRPVRPSGADLRGLHRRVPGVLGGPVRVAGAESRPPSRAPDADVAHGPAHRLPQPAGIRGAGDSRAGCGDALRPLPRRWCCSTSTTSRP